MFTSFVFVYLKFDFFRKELNKPCEVKVFQCWPRTYEDPSDMSREESERYYRRIEHMTIAKEGKMLKYDLLWGHWFFEVETWNRDFLP